MVSEISSAKRAEIKSKSVIGLPNTVTGKPDIVKNAVFDPVDIVVTEVNTIVRKTNDELTKCNNDIAENNRLIEKNKTDIQTNKANIEKNKTEISKIIDKVYPVGAIYISMVLSSPAELFGGTWEQLTADAYLKIVTSGAGKLGGTSSTHCIPIASMPSHAHPIDGVTSINTNYPGNHVSTTTYDGARNAKQGTMSVGGSQPYYPYYYGVYAWRRTA